MKKARNGSRVAFIDIRDSTGEIELIVFEKKLVQFSGVLAEDNAVAVSGKISVDEDSSPKIVLDTALSLKRNDEFSITQEYSRPQEKNPPSQISKIYIRVPSLNSREYKKALNMIGIFDGPIPVIVYDESEKKYYPVKETGASFSQTLIDELISIAGKENIVLK